MKTVLYLHGFASSPGGRKVALLRDLLEPEGYRLAAPDLNVPSFEDLDFEAMVEAALDQAAAAAPDVVVGSSLGALVALEVSRRGVGAPLVLIAPALGFGARWTEKLPELPVLKFFHHGAGQEQPIRRGFFERMATLDVGDEPPASRVTVIMGRKDESVSFEQVEGVWCRWVASKELPAGSRFVEIPEGDHGLVAHIAQIAEEIQASA